jgi:hypothetical protein
MAGPVPPQEFIRSLTGPAYDAVAVVLSDSVNFPAYARALWIGTGGDVSLVTLSGATVVFTNVPDGSQLNVVCSRVNTATTASDIVALL